MNRYDEYAMEEALRIKETTPGVTIEAITVGPSEAGAALIRALGLGASHGIHVLAAEKDTIEAVSVASWIATYARNKNYDLILTGVMSEDLMQGQVGPMVAELLSVPCATAVIKQELLPDVGWIRVERELEGGLCETMELTLPAVLTVQSSLDRPRYPTLSNMLRAKKYQFEKLDGTTLGQQIERHEIVQASHPQKSRAGRVLEGTAPEKARELLEILRQRGLLT